MSYKDFLSDKMSSLNESVGMNLVIKESGVNTFFIDILDKLKENGVGVFEKLRSIASDNASFVTWISQNKEAFGAAMQMLKPYLSSHNIELEGFKRHLKATIVSEGIIDSIKSTSPKVMMMAMLILKVAAVDSNVFAGSLDDAFAKIKAKGSEVSQIVKDKSPEILDKAKQALKTTIDDAPETLDKAVEIGKEFGKNVIDYAKEHPHHLAIGAALLSRGKGGVKIIPKYPSSQTSGDTRFDDEHREMLKRQELNAYWKNKIDSVSANMNNMNFDDEEEEEEEEEYHTTPDGFKIKKTDLYKEVEAARKRKEVQDSINARNLRGESINFTNLINKKK